jgi:Flp pilus assembly protein TadG
LSLRKVRRDQSGVALIEFAIIAAPFLALILTMLEVGLIFWVSYELDNATWSASRLIKTGQAQLNGYNQAGMVTQICSRIVILTDCASKLQLQVQTVTNFNCAANPTQPGCTTGSNYSLGVPSQKELVTVSYEWPLFNFASVALLSNLPDGNRLIQSAAVFQNEP